MTVRINKPAINLRETLSDLQREEGLRGLQILAADTAAEAVEALDLEDHTFDINGGSIDGTVIGGTTPAAISGTTGDFSGDLTVDTDTLYVDSTNNRVGVGTTTGLEKISVVSGDTYQFSFKNNSASSVGALGYDSTDNMRVFVNGSEAMRIDSSGNLLVGTTDTSGSAKGAQLRGSGKGLFVTEGDEPLFINRLSSDGTVIDIRQDTVAVGSVSVSGSTTSYNTSSDERLKENITDADDASDLIDSIQVRQFDWRADGEHQRYGMVAQELDTVAPEAVTKGETEDDMWAVDYSKLVPMLVKEIQDLRKRVAELEQ